MSLDATYRLVLVFALFHLPGVNSAVCTKILQLALFNCSAENCYDCTVSNSSDYSQIPSDADILSLQFSTETALVTPGSFPIPNRLRVMEIHLYVPNVGLTPLIPNGFFIGLSRLQTLAIIDDSHSSNPVNVYLVNGSFAGLFNLTSLTAPNLKITELPVGVFMDLRHLHTLDLSSNRLQEIPVDTFSQQQELISLFLQSNAIQSLINVSFSGLFSLKTLDLQSNQISILEQEVDFSSLVNLTVMDLSNNMITRIESNAFTALQQLQKLYLENNLITNISINAFHNLSSLLEFDLSSNSLQVIPVGVFNPLKSLKVLHLHTNTLLRIAANTFSGLSNLETLDINSNLLRVVENGGFHGLDALRNLDLSQNSIVELGSSAILTLQKLAKLDLSNNQLQTIPLGTDQVLSSSSLSYLDLSHNPLNCSCDNYWIIVWIETNNLTSALVSQNSTTCQSPMESSGRIFYTAYDYNNTCPYPFLTTTTIRLTTGPTIGSTTNSEATVTFADQSDGRLSTGAQVAIIVASVVGGITIIVIVVSLVVCYMKRCGFWDRKKSESVNSLDLDPVVLTNNNREPSYKHVYENLSYEGYKYENSPDKF